MGLLTPEQLKAISETNTVNLFFVFLIVVAPTLGGIVVLVLRNHREHQKELNKLAADSKAAQDRLEESQQELEKLRLEERKERDRINQEANNRFLISIDKFTEEMKALRVDQRNELDDVHAGLLAIPKKIQEQSLPVFKQALGDHKAIISRLDGLDDTKNKVNSIVQSQGEILSAIKELPENVKAVLRTEIDTVLAKISLIDELFTSLKPQLTAIQNEMMQRLPMPDASKVPPKTETSLPTLATEVAP